MIDDQRQIPGRGDDMPLSRVKKHQHNYVIMDKSGLTDRRLSLRARGMLAYFLTKPDDWEINIRDLMRQTPEGREALTTAMRELEKYGYAVKTLYRDDRGRLRGYITTIYETPALALTDIHTTEVSFPEVGSYEVGSREVGQPATTKEYKTTKELKNQGLKEKKHPPPPPSEGGAAGLGFLESSAQDTSREDSADFDRWWNLYPSHRRVDKQACARLWNSKHLDARTEAICANTTAMKRTKQWQAGKIPNSTTYLKQERYETSPTESARSSEMSDSLRAKLQELEREFIAQGGTP